MSTGRENLLPMIGNFEDTDIISWRNDKPVYYSEFRKHAASLAKELPAMSQIINLVTDRYLFLVAFVAGLARKQTHLLPPNRTPGMIQDIARRYPDSYILTDEDIAYGDVKIHQVPVPDKLTSNETLDFSVPPDQIGVIAFTSGSTGVPKVSEKTWECLWAGAKMAHERFWQNQTVKSNVVATVPQQHMYGLETTIIQPLLCGFSIYAGRPFYPADICRALELVEAPRVLVTTPLHIKALVNEKNPLPELHHILSATAPLSRELAQQAEEMFEAPVLEIYGCTEAGSIASRHTVDGDLWYAYNGMELSQKNDTTLVQAPGINEAVEIGDVIRLQDSHHFTIHGRTSDLINIAGKRGSIGDLNHKLNAIDGVMDAAFLLPNDTCEANPRLTAFVVAPDLSKEQILQELRNNIDPAFLPRPLYMVDVLPRTESSKLPRELLVELAKKLADKQNACS